MCHPEEPSRRVLRQSGHRPRLQGGHQCRLDGVLYLVEVFDPYPARENRNQAAVFVPKEVFDQFGRAQSAMISITSTPEPGRTSPGHPLATSIASSRLSARTTM